MQRWTPLLVAATAPALVLVVRDRLSSVLSQVVLAINRPSVARQRFLLRGVMGVKGDFRWGELHCNRCHFRASAAPVG